MRMEREREGRAQQHYQAQMEQYNRNQEWRRGIVNSILQGRGINVPGAAAAGVPGAAGGGRATPDSAKMTLSGLLGGSGAGASTGAGMFDSQGGGLPAPQNMAGALAPTAPTQPTVPQGGSLTDLSGWNDWRNHGLR
ncbi:MAG TPA: hypothetical protein VFO85_01115 [Vicinamibacteria bacterium]|nr:hypothetical protein [Vicinamibacteria bacterium]